MHNFVFGHFDVNNLLDRLRKQPQQQQTKIEIILLLPNCF